MAAISTTSADMSEVLDFERLQRILKNYEYESWYKIEFYFLGHEFRLEKINSIIALFQLIDKHTVANGLSQNITESWSRLLVIECSDIKKIEYKDKLPLEAIDKTIEYMKMNFIDEILKV